MLECGLKFSVKRLIDLRFPSLYWGYYSLCVGIGSRICWRKHEAGGLSSKYELLLALERLQGKVIAVRKRYARAWFLDGYAATVRFFTESRSFGDCLRSPCPTFHYLTLLPLPISIKDMHHPCVPHKSLHTRVFFYV